MSEPDMNSKTIGGTLAFCGWMIAKGYGTTSQVEPWQTAIRKMFGTVEGESYESLDWSTIDLDDYAARFQRLAGADYKAESIVAYVRRVRNAFDAHAHYIDTGRAPAPRRAAKQQKPAEKSTQAPKANVVPINQPVEQPPESKQPGMVTFPYPLSDGRMISLTLPPRLKADDVNRITTFIRTLQDDTPERKQLPPHTDGEQKAA